MITKDQWEKMSIPEKLDHLKSLIDQLVTTSTNNERTRENINAAVTQNADLSDRRLKKISDDVTALEKRIEAIEARR